MVFAVYEFVSVSAAFAEAFQVQLEISVGDEPARAEIAGVELAVTHVCHQRFRSGFSIIFFSPPLSGLYSSSSSLAQADFPSYGVKKVSLSL